jgi:hypothetical protein
LVSNHPKPGWSSARVTDRHGRKGHVPLSTSLPPAVKDDLVAYCARNDVTLKDTVEAALWLFLSTPTAEQRRWYGR